MSEKPLITTYWEGPMPAYIELCVASMARDHDVLMLTVSDWEKYVPVWVLQDPLWEALKPAHRADILRVCYLKECGGIWLDADCIVMNSLQPIWWEHLSENEFYYYDDGGGPTNGILFSSNRHPVLVEWYRNILTVFANHVRLGTSGSDIPWTAFGQSQLKEILQCPIGRTANLGKSRVQPIDWPSWQRFFEEFADPKEARTKIWPAAYTYMLFNNLFPEWFKKKSSTEILEGRWLISSIFRIALGKGPW